MKLLSNTLFLCLALGLTNAAPAHQEGAAVADEHLHDPALPDRCAGIEFDAIAPDEKGNVFFFKGEHLWKGFSAGAHLSNENFRELHDAHHLGHVDAAFRMDSEDMDHNHIYFFQDDMVFSYYNHTLKEGYPKEIQQDFPGIPSQLDAAVECPEGDCITDSVLFFKGHDVYSFDIATKTANNKTWSHLPVCTSALRWQEHYYCFHGHNFTRFHQQTGEVTGNYPKDARNYFMMCTHLMLDLEGQNDTSSMEDLVFARAGGQKKVDHFFNNGLLKFYRNVFQPVISKHGRSVADWDGYLKNDPNYKLYKNTITDDIIYKNIVKMGALPVNNKPSGGDDNSRDFSNAYNPLVTASVNYVNCLYICRSKASLCPPSCTGSKSLPGLRRNVVLASNKLRNMRAARFDDDAYNRWQTKANAKDRQPMTDNIKNAETAVKEMLDDIADNLARFAHNMYLFLQRR